MDYHILREIADSWVLLAMFAFFVGVLLWVMRPGSRETYTDSADIVFRHDDTPAPQDPVTTNTEEARS